MTTHLIIRVDHGPQDLNMEAKCDNVATKARRSKKKVDDDDEIYCDVLPLVTSDPADDLAKKIAHDYGRGAFTSMSKFYLMGHSDFAQQKLGDKAAPWFADVLNAIPLPKIKNVNILGCSLGRDAGTNDKTLVAHSANSFASQLHERLTSRNDVIARVFDVKIEGLTGLKSTVIDGSGEKSLANPMRKRYASKLRFFWEGNLQKREWVKYGGDAALNFDDYSLDRFFDLD